MKKTMILKSILVIGAITCTLNTSGVYCMTNSLETTNKIIERDTIVTEPVENTAETENIVPQYQKLSDYMRTVYTTSTHPEWDEIFYNGLDMYENDKENAKHIYFYITDNAKECYQIQYYLMGRYGYTLGLEIVYVKTSDNKQFKIVFDNSLDADKKIKEYKDEVQKAQAIAATLKGNTKDETIDNTINWVYNNVKYNWNYKDLKRAIEGYYGVYEGNPVICGGFACTLVQLLNMNGVNCEEVAGTENGENHMWNKVETSNGWVWYDTVNKISSTTLWTEYALNDWCKQ